MPPAAQSDAALPRAAQAHRSSGVEEEPRLRYGPLAPDSPRASTSVTSRLCVSDKVLALGHQDGSVQLLDHLGNQVKAFKEHTREVTDLCFDDAAEFLASCSADGTIAVYGLYSEEVQRLKIASPVTTVCLDPRYGSRKTRDLVYGTAGGALMLSSKGWLGSRETPLFTGKGPLRAARMSGTLLAWATDTGIRVYDTATHARLGKLERPASAAEDPGAPCSLLWRGDRELFVSWGRHVTMVRVVGSSLSPSSTGGMGGLLPSSVAGRTTTTTTTSTSATQAGRSLQIVASFDVGGTAIGAAPFGADVAVLVWGLSASLAAAEGPADRQGGGLPAAPPSSAQDTGGTILSGSSTAEGEAEAAAGAPSDVTPQQLQAAAVGSSQQQVQDQQQPQAAQVQQEQQLSLSFYSRSGQLLASDALGCECAAAERRWHQLAFSYPGDADLRLAAAAGILPPALQPPSRQQAAASPAHSPQTSTHGDNTTGSTPAKPAAAAPSDAAAADGVASANDAAEEANRSAAAGSHEARQDRGAEASLPGQALQPTVVQQYKWWRDGEEPMYFVCTPHEIIVGRPRDGNDRVSWLVMRGRFAEALRIAEEDRTVQPGVREAVGEQYLRSLLEAGQYREAAALTPRVLQGNGMAWERWAFTFAQQRQLAALAPHLPTDSPRLKPSTYDLVLASLLLHPSDHEVLLRLVKAWPPAIYDGAQLQAALLNRMGGAAGAWPALREAAAHLYTVQGRHEEALRLMLQAAHAAACPTRIMQLRSPAVFDYIARHALMDRVSPLAAALVDLDEVRATSLLVEHCEEVPPAQVVASLQDAAASSASDEERQRWRRRLHHYLDWLFQRDSQGGADFAELQVELYAEFEPSRLLHFLMVSPSYPLEKAYQVCERRGLVREMVFVLGRMGSADKALRLIVEGLRDVVQAVEFVQLQRDEELWETLVALTLGDAQLTGALLDHAGGYIDPLKVVSQIPPRMRVDNLRGRLVKIITDFRTQMSLQQGCNTILRHDCVVLANRLYRVLRSCLRRLHLHLHAGAGGSRWVQYDCRTGEETAEDDALAALLAGQADGSGAAAALREPAISPGSRAQQQRQQQQQQQRVWVGFLGGPPPAVADPHAEQLRPQQASPSKFLRLTGSAGPSPARGLPSRATPRKLLAT